MTKTSFLRSKTIWRWGLLLLAILVAVLALQWLTYERQPLPQALEALQSDAQVAVSRLDRGAAWLTFTPAAQTTTGFIFYPGGRISFLGYSDFLHAIAAEGYLVVVPQMPLNIAAFRLNAADEIIAAHPEITTWVIGGHSVGGTMAAQYLQTERGAAQVAGLVIWASYPADNVNLSGRDVQVTVIYGSLDPNANEESVLARRHLLPADTVYARLDGGDHHQFGSYVIQPQDRHATLSRAAQREQVIQATLELLKRTVDHAQK